jgi:hypothetical protein
MKRFVPSLAFFAVISIVFASCYYDSEESLYPTLNSSCDTTNVTYSVTVVSILANNCLSCHSSAAVARGDGGGFVLDNYANVKSQAASISAAINQTGANSPMPKNGSKLKACLITQFDIWFRKGMLNN